MENKKEKCEKQKRKRKKNKTKKAAPLERVGEVRERVPRTPAYHVPRTDPLSQRSLEGSLSRQTWSQVVAGPSRLSLGIVFWSRIMERKNDPECSKGGFDPESERAFSKRASKVRVETIKPQRSRSTEVATTRSPPSLSEKGVSNETQNDSKTRRVWGVASARSSAWREREREKIPRGLRGRFGRQKVFWSRADRTASCEPSFAVHGPRLTHFSQTNKNIIFQRSRARGAAPHSRHSTRRGPPRCAHNAVDFWKQVCRDVSEEGPR